MNLEISAQKPGALIEVALIAALYYFDNKEN